MLQAYHSEYQTDVDLSPMVKDPFLLTKEDYKRTQYEGRFKTKFNDMFNLTLGAESRQDTRGSDNLNPEYDTDNQAGFGQLDMLFFDRLNLVAGVRIDDHSEFGSEWSPKLAASLSINPNLRLKASYGHGFRAPSSYELYVTAYKRRGKEIYLPNKNLEPETTDSYEIGLQSNLDLAKGLDVELTWFRNDIEDLIEAMPLASPKQGKSKVKRYQYANISQAVTSGLELLGSLHLPFNFSFGAGMTYLNTENKDTGEQLPYQPRFKGNLNAGWGHADWGLRARVSYNWHSGREDGLGNDLEDYSTVSAWVGKDLCESLMLYAGMKNIFDTELEEYELEPAFVYLGVRWEY
jgi:outer membrane receptor for ferrienterochelin and colicins